jgi:hypothetical protein
MCYPKDCALRLIKTADADAFSRPLPRKTLVGAGGSVKENQADRAAVRVAHRLRDPVW